MEHVKVLLTQDAARVRENADLHMQIQELRAAMLGLRPAVPAAEPLALRETPERIDLTGTLSLPPAGLLAGSAVPLIGAGQPAAVPIVATTVVSATEPVAVPSRPAGMLNLGPVLADPEALASAFEFSESIFSLCSDSGFPSCVQGWAYAGAYPCGQTSCCGCPAGEHFTTYDGERTCCYRI